MEEKLSGKRLVRAEAQKQLELSEDQLARVEAQPGFQRQMQESAADIEAGRVMTQAQLEKRLR